MAKKVQGESAERHPRASARGVPTDRRAELLREIEQLLRQLVPGGDDPLDDSVLPRLPLDGLQTIAALYRREVVRRRGGRPRKDVDAGRKTYLEERLAGVPPKKAMADAAEAAGVSHGTAWKHKSAWDAELELLQRAVSKNRVQ